MPSNVKAPRRTSAIVEQLRSSRIYKDYEEAFRSATGMPLALRTRGLGDYTPPHRGDPNENPFCALMARSNHTCATCLAMQRRIETETNIGPKTLHCFAGLCDSAVPVRVGENIIAFLQTGQVLLHEPTKQEFSRSSQLLLKMGSEIDVRRLEETYFQTQVLDRSRYDSILRLLEVFAQHLAALSTELTLKAEEPPAPPSVHKARGLIDSRHHEELTLSEVAKAVNMSSFYFCKMFKRSTGLTFTDYLARVRVQKVKNLLINPHKRISEAAFECGFQSLSQFNRVFKKVTGEAPKAYRARLQTKNAPAAS
ncbi:AraC family transcriptional regulator [Cephaloticoccus primus]|uniref:AraC family transcriptional regulator n=1 Tax=Cephaloticoccus primus TaxID=1548207 RepID=A0A139SQ52_9BACT|nr:helix-turn-helix domain-containing protein [Cephaloticoccus primus]KXU36662.1 AraC family transcriptional regulator [Cephaloticoccus primus]